MNLHADHRSADRSSGRGLPFFNSWGANSEIFHGTQRLHRIQTAVSVRQASRGQGQLCTDATAGAARGCQSRMSRCDRAQRLQHLLPGLREEPCQLFPQQLQLQRSATRLHKSSKGVGCYHVSLSARHTQPSPVPGTAPDRRDQGRAGRRARPRGLLPAADTAQQQGGHRTACSLGSQTQDAVGGTSPDCSKCPGRSTPQEVSEKSREGQRGQEGQEALGKAGALQVHRAGRLRFPEATRRWLSLAGSQTTTPGQQRRGRAGPPGAPHPQAGDALPGSQSSSGQQ